MSRRRPLFKVPSGPDLTGQQFGNWRVQGQHRDRQRWLCACVCGAVVPITGAWLLDGRYPLSCGCLHPPEPLLATYKAMIARCSDPSLPFYVNYGGRGIQVCERWRRSYDDFLADMGPKPTPQHSIDRIDNNGNYEPSNCRWATKTEQMANRRTSAQVAADRAAYELRRRT